MKGYLILLLLLPFSVFAEGFQLSGKVNYTYRFGKDYLPIKVFIKNSVTTDSTVIDTSFQFHFKNLKHGTYQIRISALAGQTGFADILITDVLLNGDLVLPVINLQKVKMCESAVVILGKKSEREYYSTGELKATGKYLHSFKYEPHKPRQIYYKKTGTWLYYDKDGNLEKKYIYKGDDLKCFTVFYKNRKMKFSGYYSNGCRTGDWKYYSTDGELKFVVNFNDLFLIKIRNNFLANYMADYNLLNQ